MKYFCLFLMIIMVLLVAFNKRQLAIDHDLDAIEKCRVSCSTDVWNKDKCYNICEER